jgi:hypothetical protein
VLRDAVPDRVDVVDDQTHRVVDFADLARASLQMKLSFLRRALGLQQRLSLAFERRFAARMICERRRSTAPAARCAAAPARRQAVWAASRCARSCAVCASISASSAAICSPRWLTRCACSDSLSIASCAAWMPLLQGIYLDAQRVERGLALREIVLGHGKLASERRELLLARSSFDREPLDLTLPRQHAVQLGIGRMKAHAVPREDVAVARHQQRTGWQLLAPRHALVRVAHDVNLVQPIVQCAGRGSVLAPHERRERFEAIDRRRQRSPRRRSCRPSFFPAADRR